MSRPYALNGKGMAPSVRLLGVLAAFALTACGSLTADNPPVGPTGSGAFRRTYVNDSAAADSLTAGIVRSGIKFVLQPGKEYQLSIKTVRTEDHLSLFYYSDGGIQGQFQTLAAKSDGTQEFFPLISSRSAAQFYVAQLVVSDGLGAINGLGHVSLVSKNVTITDTLHLRLLFIRTLQGLPDSASKDAFAKTLFKDMAAVYAPFGISMQGSYEIVDPAGPKVSFPFSNTYIPLPGTRVANNAHLYLVDTITIGNPGSGLVGEVLGFAPREVVDLDQDRESRVLLANPHPSSDIAIERLAITATHELGHFFGLRHTVSTQNDLLQDDDYSNVEDGFTDTKFCQLDQQLAKAGVRTPPAWLGDLEAHYCLRIADNSCNPFACDLTNLMHPVDCGSTNQVNLSPQQIAFFTKNLSTYRH